MSAFQPIDADLATAKRLATGLFQHRDDLRDLPEAMAHACELARHMAEYLLAHSAKDRPHYLNQRSLDAVLAMIQGSASHLATISMDLLGEDEDHPTMQ